MWCFHAWHIINYIRSISIYIYFCYVNSEDWYKNDPRFKEVYNADGTIDYGRKRVFKE